MPLPKPRRGESKDDFLSRCMGNSVMVSDYDDEGQRFAVCNAQWSKKAKRVLPKTYTTDRQEAGKIRKDMGITGMERRFVRIRASEMRVDEAEGVIEGYGARFGVWSEQLGYFREKIQPGAFAKTIKENDIRCLFNHDANLVLGRSKAKTLELSEDEKGLSYRAKLPDTSYAKDLVISIARKDISQNSFGFEVVADAWNKDQSRRVLEEVKLFDVGPVTFPAYPQTSVSTRSVLADVGIDFDAVVAALARQQRGIEVTDKDVDLLRSTIEVLNSLIPKDEPVAEHPQGPLAEDHSEESQEPDVISTRLRTQFKILETTLWAKGLTV